MPDEDRHYPPKGTWTRRYFLVFVIALTVVLLGAHLIGPILMAAPGADPRPFAALLPPIYITVLLLGVVWIAWFVWFRRP